MANDHVKLSKNLLRMKVSDAKKQSRSNLMVSISSDGSKPR